MSTTQGRTFIPARDGARLGKQYQAVARFMREQGENWSTLAGIAKGAAPPPASSWPPRIYPEASVSARLRDLRRDGWIVEREYVADGLHRYRAFPPESQGALL